MADKSYEQQLAEKLAAARKRVRQGREITALKNAAPTLYEIIDGEISLELNRGYNDTKPLSYDEYLESHGAVRGIRRIRNLLDAKEVEEGSSTEEVNALRDAIKQIEDDKKPK